MFMFYAVSRYTREYLFATYTTGGKKHKPKEKFTFSKI